MQICSLASFDFVQGDQRNLKGKLKTKNKDQRELECSVNLCWKNISQTLESPHRDINSWCLCSHFQFLKCFYVRQLRTAVKRRAVQALLFSRYKGEYILIETDCIPWGHSPFEPGDWCLILDLLTPNLPSFCPITNSTGLGYPGKVACVATPSASRTQSCRW